MTFASHRMKMGGTNGRLTTQDVLLFKCGLRVVWTLCCNFLAKGNFLSNELTLKNLYVFVLLSIVFGAGIICFKITAKRPLLFSNSTPSPWLSSRKPGRRLNLMPFTKINNPNANRCFLCPLILLGQITSCPELNSVDKIMIPGIL